MAEENQNLDSEEQLKENINVQDEEQKNDESSAQKEQSQQAPETESSEESEQEVQEEQKELTLEEKYALLEKENLDLKDQLLRRAADFDNYRKRMMKEKLEAAEYANANLLSDLLESLDNFDRTVEAASTATDVSSITDGIKIINSNLVKMLEDKYGLTGYAKEGDIFNPDEHEAIGRVEEEVTEQTLKQVYLKGYKLKDKIIRNAKVMVSVPKE